MNLFKRFQSKQRVVANLTETWKEGQPTYSETNFETLVREGWRKNELIFACINKKSKTAAQVHMGFGRGEKKKALPYNHPLNKLIQRPNPVMSEYDLWSIVIIYQDLAGRAIFEKERDRSGNVIALWPLRPDWIRITPSKRSPIGEYSYDVPGVGAFPLAPEDVLDFRIWDPLNRYHSFPPVAVAGRVGSVDNSTTDYLKLFFERGGVPAGLIKTIQKLRDTEVSDIRRRWRERYGGYQNWMDPAVLDKDASYERTGLTFLEMGFEILDARNESRICSILEVPPIIVNAKVGLDRSTFSNYKEARLAWWEDTLIPIYVNFNDVVQNNLCADYGEDVQPVWDFTQVPAMREERITLWNRANEGLKMGGITVNEYRAEIGLPDIGKTGDVFLRPLNIYEVPLGESGQMPTSEPNPPRQQLEQDELDSGEDEEEETETEASAKTREFKKSNPTPPALKDREQLAKQMEVQVSRYMKTVKGKVVAAVKDQYGD